MKIKPCITLSGPKADEYKRSLKKLTEVGINTSTTTNKDKLECFVVNVEDDMSNAHTNETKCESDIEVGVESLSGVAMEDHDLN